MSSGNWAKELSKGLVDLESLVKKGAVAENQLDLLGQAKEKFDIRVPAIFADSQLLEEGIFAQFVPDIRELDEFTQELTDPIGDEKWTPIAGLTHRYPDRVLVKLTYQCSSYCRFCFRKYKVSNPEENINHEDLTKILEYISQHHEIFEVILTGGDPMVLTDKKLALFMSALAEIPHVKILRIHTRVLTTLPERVNQSLVETLQSAKKTIWWVAHINHIKEITEKTRDALIMLQKNNISLLSQSVLLNNVNANLQDLLGLFRELVTLGIKPYYLHYPDLTKGTNHFRIPLQQAIELYAQLRGRLSGIAIPQFIVDIPGGHGKVAIEPSRAKKIAANKWEFISPITGNKVTIEYP